nr:MAG TPA: hypothetical protein [Crassvirales sp.]
MNVEITSKTFILKLFFILKILLLLLVKVGVIFTPTDEAN